MGINNFFQQQNKDNINNVLKTVFKYKFYLIIFFFIIVIITLIMYFIAPKKYLSTAILFPTKSSSISQSIISQNNQKKDILAFGEDTELEQLIEISSSDFIKKRIIEKYDLFNHYKIDKNSKFAYTNVSNKLESNVSIKKTQNMAIKLSVLDESPDTAALIANTIINLIDTTFNNIQHERAIRAFEIVEIELNEQRAKIKRIEDTLSVLADLGVIDIKTQISSLGEIQKVAIEKGNTQMIDDIKKQIAIINKYGNSQLIFTAQLSEEVKQLSIIEGKYREAIVDLQQELPNTYVVNYPSVPERKYEPNFYNLLIINLLIGAIISLVAIMILSKISLIKNDK